MNSELSIVKTEPSICDTEFEWDTNKNISKFCNSLNFLSSNMTHFKASFLDFVKNADSIFFQENSFELHFETTYVKPLQHLQTIVHQDIYENLDITKSQQINILNLFLNTAWNLEDLFIWTEKEISTYQKEGQHQNAFLPKKLHFIQNEIKKIEKSSHKISELLEVLTGFNLNIKRLIEKKVHEISNAFIDSAEATLNNTQYGLQQRVDAYQEVIKGLTNRINDIELEINCEFIKNPQMPHNYQKELLNLYLIALSNWDKVCTRLLNIISSNTGYGNDDRKAMNDLTQELQQYILDKIASTQTNLDKISIAPLLEKIRDTMMKYNKQNHSLFSQIVDTFDHKISDENYQQIKKNLENFKKFLNNIKDATVINNFKKIEKVKVDLINALMSVKHIISSTDNTEYQLTASEISEDELQQKRNQYFKAIKDNFNQIEEIFLKLFNKYQNDFNAYDKLNFASKNANITNKDFWTNETELSDFEVKINQVSSFINEWIGYFNNKDTENKWIKEKEKIIKEKDQLIAARDELITENHKLINDKDTTEEEKEKLKDRNKELEKEKK